MTKPVANFSFDIQGLSVQFTDSSSGVPSSWNWDFDFSGGISTEQNPLVDFPNAGIYTITLVASNGNGNSVPFTFDLVITEAPGIGLTIKELVLSSMPIGIAADTNTFKASIRKWQLYLRPFTKPLILDADVFNEAKWGSLWNVLISKLIIYDIILDSVRSSAASYYSALSLYNNQIQTTSSTIQVADYTYIFPEDMSISTRVITINSLLSNGVNLGPSPELTLTNLLLWLNGRNIGHFSYNPTTNTLSCLACSNVLTTFNVTIKNSVGNTNNGYNGVFTMTNTQIVPITQSVEVSGQAPSGMKGSVKYMEMGPSKTEWYNGSDFWSMFFRSMPGASGPNSGGTGGIFENLVKDICMFAGRVGARLPMCPKTNSSGFHLAISRGSRGKCCGR